jgi:hypothetical protein
MNRGMVGRVGSRGLVALALVAGLLAVPLTAGAEQDDAPDARGTASPSSLDGPPGPVAPPNDDLSDAQVITGAAGVIAGSTEEATLEPGESEDPDAGPSVWYSWTAPAVGDAFFTTQGAAFDTTLTVYTVTELDTLTEVAFNDDDGDSTSRATFTTDAAATYLIRVGGWDTNSFGPFELEWGLSGFPPSNDGWATRFIGGLEGSIRGTTVDATHQTGEPDHGSAGTAHSVWYAFTTSLPGEVDLLLDLPAWDPVVAVYTGDTLEALTSVGSQSFEAEVGTTYWIAVDGALGDSGPFTLSWTTEVLAPANDDFVDAEVLPGASGTVDGYTFAATTETEEPSHAGEGSAHSIWYSWTAPSAGEVQIDTFGSDFDTLLGVYTGSALDGLTEVAANDQTDGNQSRVRFEAVAGTTYSIAVDGYEGEQGFVELYYGPVPVPFDDVPRDHPFFDEIAWMHDTGLSTGFEDGTYRPSASVTRQAMAAFLFRLDGEPALPPVIPDVATFSDVSESHPFYDAITYLALIGVTEGYPDGTFRGGQAITRQAMSAFLHRFEEGPDDDFEPPTTPTFSDVSPSHPFYADVEWMADSEISEGYEDGTYRPSGLVTRQAMAAFLYRIGFCGCPV